VKGAAKGLAEPDVKPLVGLDRVVHEPARLALLTILTAADEVEFLFLEQATGLTKGNLSAHMAKLETAGYVEVRKAFRGKLPVTSYRITEAGAKALRKYRAALFQGLGRT
jgi:DNA-binding transcriptional ArsR family regulator